jgi:hypothetical protein
LACCIGKKKVVEAGGIEVLLAAAIITWACPPYANAQFALKVLIADSSDNTELFICLGGASIVAKVKNKMAREL